MLISAAKLKRGMCVIVEGYPVVIVDSRYIKFGKSPLFVQVEFRDVLSGILRKIHFYPTKRLEKKDLTIRWMHYLRSEGNDCIFSDPTTEEQVAVPNDFLGHDAQYLAESSLWKIIYLDESVFAAIPLSGN